MVHSIPKKYSTSLSKNRSLIPETIKVLQIYSDGMRFEDLEKSVIQSGVLSPLSSNRIKEILRQGIKKRFFLKDQLPLYLKKLSSLSLKDYSQILFLYFCRSEYIVYDFIHLFLCPAIKEGRVEINKTDVEVFIQNGLINGKLPEPWKLKMKQYVVQGIFQVLVDYGYLKKSIGFSREILGIQTSETAVIYLAYELHFSGESDYSILNHTDWNLFLLSKDNVIQQFENLSYQNHIIFQHAVDIVHITWKYKSMEEVIDVLLGKFV